MSKRDLRLKLFPNILTVLQVQCLLSNCVVEIIYLFPKSACSPIQPQLHRQVHEVCRKKRERVRPHEEDVRVSNARKQPKKVGDEPVGLPEGGNQVLSGALHVTVWSRCDCLHLLPPSSSQLYTLGRLGVSTAAVCHQIIRILL